MAKKWGAFLIVDLTKLLKLSDYKGRIAAIARYEDERETLVDMGVDSVFNYYVEAGTGFAEESLHLIEGFADKLPKEDKPAWAL